MTTTHPIKKLIVPRFNRNAALADSTNYLPTLHSYLPNNPSVEERISMETLRLCINILLNLTRSILIFKMPFVKVYIHFIWSTKNRVPFLDSINLRTKVWNHIRENAKKKDIYIDHINGYSDHCHCLISLGTNQNIEKVMFLIKGESSYWINKNKLTLQKFEWQDEYFAVSVSESMLDRVRKYIRNQETHHKRKTFQEEYDELITKYGFERFEDK